MHGPLNRDTNNIIMYRQTKRFRCDTCCLVLVVIIYFHFWFNGQLTIWQWAGRATTQAPILSKLPRAQALRPCLDVAQAIGVTTSDLKAALHQRETWGNSPEPFLVLERALNDNKRSVPYLPRFFSGLSMDWRRFDMMGPVVLHCPNVQQFGSGDEEKRFCFPPLDANATQKTCVIYSIGSNNVWSFEEAVLTNTACVIHVFDCTVSKSPRLRAAIVFHRVCLGAGTYITDRGWHFMDLAGLTQLAGVPATFIKMDIEGFEWDVLLNIVKAGAIHMQQTGQDIFPRQIAVEMHYFALSKQLQWYGRDRSPGEIYTFFNHLFRFGGYVIAERRDNNVMYGCAFCTEVLLVRAACPTYI